MSAVAQIRAEREREATGQFTVTLNLTQQRGISMVGYVYSDDSPADVNKRIDSYQDALDRQFVRADIVTKKAQVTGHIQNLKNLNQAYDALVAKKNREGGKKLTSQELNHIEGYDASVKAATAMIESLRAAIAEAEAQLKA